jgi:hypothetical protein
VPTTKIVSTVGQEPKTKADYRLSKSTRAYPDCSIRQILGHYVNDVVTLNALGFSDNPSHPVLALSVGRRYRGQMTASSRPQDGVRRPQACELSYWCWGRSRLRMSGWRQLAGEPPTLLRQRRFVLASRRAQFRPTQDTELVYNFALNQRN